MKNFFVIYSVTDRKRTKKYSCTVQAETRQEARLIIVRNGGKILKIEQLP